jgi:ELP3 family radical SAM enzyme/protein acetyltransferase
MFSTKWSPNYTENDILKIFDKDNFKIELIEDDIQFAKPIFLENMEKVTSQQTYVTHILNKMRKQKIFQGKTAILKAYYILVTRNEVPYNPTFIKFGSIKSTRGHSGVQVVTIFTSGNFMQSNNIGNNDIEEFNKKGGCPMNCYYCPFEKDEQGIPTQPRSYLSTEPGNKRASQNKHHPVGQMFDRIFQLEEIGHIPNAFLPTEYVGAKLEMIISGGTFNFYPKEYIIWFVTCMYYAANVYYEYRRTNKFPREMLSLEREQYLNETTSLRIIGLTIETRPDYLNPLNFDKKAETVTTYNDKYAIIRFFRELGITRVQIGIQHTNNMILKKVNRQCTDKQNREAIKFLKDNGFKVDIHLMLDLPYSSPEEDKNMLTKILTNSEYEADQWKIYPTEVTNYTVIKKWYDEGKYQPYSEEENGEKLMDVIIHAKTMMKPWIRINRIIRDIPPESIEGGIDCPDMRDVIYRKMKTIGISCNCIRCREIKLEKIPDDSITQMIRHYEGSDGDEYFISYETIDEKKLIGYIRLRLNRSFDNTMPELHNYAFIRELHVLGHHTNVGVLGTGVQHKGYGTKLIEKAEEIAYKNGYKGISIISGIGVREYYQKKGYILENHNMVKLFDKTYNFNQIFIIILNIIVLIICIVYFIY